MAPQEAKGVNNRDSVPVSAELPQGSEKDAKESMKSGDVIFSDINDIKSVFAPKSVVSGKSKVTALTGKLSKRPKKEEMKVVDIVDEEKLSEG